MLQDKARAAGLAIDFSRVEVIPTDLAAPQLGLDIAALAATRRAEVDAILHCGAFVHHLHSYEEMKGANVGRHRRPLLRLALTRRQKPFCFISTLSVGEMLAGAERIDEHVSNARPLLDNGYLLTKWVGEQRAAECCASRLLPACRAVIARSRAISPAMVVPASATSRTTISWLFTTKDACSWAPIHGWRGRSGDDAGRFCLPAR